MDTAIQTSEEINEKSEKLEKLKSLVEKIRFCMMTTTGSDGDLHSRPMSFLEWSAGENLLFFTSATSNTLQQIKAQRTVNLSFCEPSKNIYVSVFGEATVLNDQTLKNRLFSPIMRNWFPGGPEDPNLRLLAVSPTTAEYWDGLSGLSLLLSLAKLKITDAPQPMGEYEYFEL